VNRTARILIAILAVALAALVYDDLRLRGERDASAQKAAPNVASVSSSTEPETAKDPADKPPLWRRFAPSPRKRPELAKEKTESRSERRQRRSLEMRELLGRADGESEADYIARIRPFVVVKLAEPRNRLNDARANAESLAKVSDEQRSQVDEILNDSYSEAMDLVNEAVQSGELNPYRRNWSGALSVAGGFGAVLDGADRRIGEVLSPEQRQIIYEQGFEWGEYIGVSAPWEDLRPPPPPQAP